MNTTNKTYRSDIDGLRALAVSAVILYHAFPYFIKYGFLGVDIFFVISGFLITGILISGLEKGEFSIINFYDRRFKRIFPALIFAIFISTILGAFILNFDDYRDFSRSVMYSILSISNFFFYKNTDYFDAESNMMPLLHTWSLAVEEQFYFVWPVILFLIFHINKEKSKILIPLVLLAIIIMSFIFFSYERHFDEKAAFYLPISRFWELALGSILVFIKINHIKYKFKSISSIFSLGIIIVSLFGISKGVTTSKILLTIGTCGLILRNDGEIGKILSLKPLIFIGKISYSLYLWHWIIFVFYRQYKNGEAINSIEFLYLIIISLIIAYVSWRFIEKPFRDNPSKLKKTVGVFFICFLMLCLGFIININNGFPERLPKEIRSIGSREQMWFWKCPEVKNFEGVSEHCSFGAPWNSATHHAFLWGDSHAEHFAPILDIVGQKNNISFLLFRACPPIINGINIRYKLGSNYNDSCRDYQNKAIEFINKPSSKIDMVVLAASWSDHAVKFYSPVDLQGGGLKDRGLFVMKNGFNYLIPKISNKSRKVIILGDIPHFNSDPIACLIAKSKNSFLLRDKNPCFTDPDIINIEYYKTMQEKTNTMLQSVPNEFKNVITLIPGNYLCDNSGCLTWINNEFIYRDADHMRRNLNKETKIEMAKKLNLFKVTEFND